MLGLFLVLSLLGRGLANDASTESMHVPFSVSIALMSESVNAHKLATSLETTLTAVLPEYSPGNRFEDVLLKLKYSVVVASSSTIEAYGAFLRTWPKDEQGHHLVTVDQVAHFVRNTFHGGDDAAAGLHSPRPLPQLQSSLTNLPLVIVTAAPSLPPHIIHSGDHHLCTQSAAVGVAFMDLTAKLCDLRPTALSSPPFSLASTTTTSSKMPDRPLELQQTECTHDGSRPQSEGQARKARAASRRLDAFFRAFHSPKLAQINHHCL